MGWMENDGRGSEELVNIVRSEMNEDGFEVKVSV